MFSCLLQPLQVLVGDESDKEQLFQGCQPGTFLLYRSKGNNSNDFRIAVLTGAKGLEHDGGSSGGYRIMKLRVEAKPAPDSSSRTVFNLAIARLKVFGSLPELVSHYRDEYQLRLPLKSALQGQGIDPSKKKQGPLCSQ